jgi:tetratricopeptide (TPR) repeat protein
MRPVPRPSDRGRFPPSDLRAESRRAGGERIETYATEAPGRAAKPRREAARREPARNSQNRWAAVLASCLAFFWSGAALAQENVPDLQKVKKAIDGLQAVQAWQIDEARKLAEEQFRESPDDPFTLALMAEVKMHMSDYAGAVDFFKRAENRGAPPELIADAPLAEAARVATDGYAEFVGEHFVVRHTPGKDAILAHLTIDALERARERIGELLGWKPQSRIAVEIYPTPSTLAQVSTLTEADIENSGTIALCRWNRLMITSPRGVMYGYPWGDTLAHELAHLIIGGASKNTVPIWLHEGLAKYVETAWDGEPGSGLSKEQQEALRDAAVKKKLIPFEKMHPSMAKLPTREDTSLAFSEVFTFIEYLVDRKGWEGIREVLAHMSRGKSDAEAIAAVFGESLDALEGKWKKSLLTREIKDGARANDQQPIIKKRADAPDDALHGVSKKGRRYARAADLLFARGRMKAAQTELEKAYGETRSPAIAAKLAMVALANGDLENSEKYARHALEGADTAGPRITLAEILVRRQKYDEAKQHLRRAKYINPFDPRIHRLSLAILGDKGDEKEKKDAAFALALIEGEIKLERGSLGKGGLVQIDGRPFSRVFLRKEGESSYVPTGMVTPTNPVGIEPGRFELMLVPPNGGSASHVIEVNEAPEDGSAQTITTGPTGS